MSEAKSATQVPEMSGESGKARGETPLERFHARAMVASVASGIATAMAMVAYVAARAEEEARYAAMTSMSPELNRVTDVYTSAYHAAQSVTGVALAVLVTCAVIAGASVVVLVASSLASASKSS